MSRVQNNSSSLTIEAIQEEPIRRKTVVFRETDIDGFPKYRNKRYCCCFNTRKSCCIVWLSLSFVLVCCFAITGFVAFPRIPSIKLSDPFSPVEGLAGLNYQIQPNGTFSDFSYDIAINFTIASTNYIDLYASQISTQVYLQDLNGRKVPNFNGMGIVYNASFPGFQTRTYTMPITMVYSPMYKVVGGDPTLKVLNASIAGSNPQKLNIQYDIHIVLPLISWTGYTITVPGSFSVDVAEMIGDQRPFVVQLLDKISQVIN